MSKSKTYSNPNSKARSRKEYNKKSEEKAYSNAQRSKKREDIKKHENGKKPSRTSNNRVSYGNRKARINKKGELIDVRTGRKIIPDLVNKNKLNMTETSNKPVNNVKKTDVKTIISTDNFNRLYIELPVTLNMFHKLSVQSRNLILNFFTANPWAKHYIDQNFTSYADCAKTEKYWIYKYFLKVITKNHFNFNNYYHENLSFISNDRDIHTYKGVFFYKSKNTTTKKTQWFFVMNLQSLYDSYAYNCKNNNMKIPYSISINHLIYNNISNNVEPDAAYPLMSRIAFVLATEDMYKIKTPIEPAHNSKYILYINDKNKRRAMDKYSTSYDLDRLNKVVIKEIPINTKR